MNDFAEICPECEHTHADLDGTCGVDGCTCMYEEDGEME